MTTFTYKTFTVTLNITAGEPTATVCDNCTTKIVKEPKEFATAEQALDFINHTIERLANHQMAVLAERIVECKG